MKKLGVFLVDKIKIPPIERKWYICEKCGQPLLIYDNTAKSNNVFLKCKRCGHENEIKI